MGAPRHGWRPRPQCGGGDRSGHLGGDHRRSGPRGGAGVAAARAPLPRRSARAGRAWPYGDSRGRRPGHRLDHARRGRRPAQQQPACLVVAVPVGAAETCSEFRGEADEVICARTPTHSTPSACGTTISPRLLTRKFASFLSGRPQTALGAAAPERSRLFVPRRETASRERQRPESSGR